MYGFCRLGVSPAPLSRAVACRRARDDDEHEREEGRDPTEHRHDPGDEVAQETPVERDRESSEAGQDEQPEEKRALLPTHTS